MATSSIFYNIVLKTPEEIERFLDALEESEREAAKWEKTSHTITSLRDSDEIRKLIAKRPKPDK